jgi:hypothetical protein
MKDKRHLSDFKFLSKNVNLNKIALNFKREREERKESEKEVTRKKRVDLMSSDLLKITEMRKNWNFSCFVLHLSSASSIVSLFVRGGEKWG